MKDKHVKLRVHSTGAPASSGAGQYPDGRKSIAFNALGWHMAERFAQSQMIPGDCLDIAFTLDHNHHPEFGGLELSLKDFQAKKASAKEEPVAQSQTK